VDNVLWYNADRRICGCCIRIRAGISVRVRVRVRDGVRISNRVRRRVKLVNYSLITALPFATSADPHIRLSAFYPWPWIIDQLNKKKTAVRALCR